MGIYYIKGALLILTLASMYDSTTILMVEILFFYWKCRTEQIEKEMEKIAWTIYKVLSSFPGVSLFFPFLFTLICAKTSQSKRNAKDIESGGLIYWPLPT